MRPHLIAMVLGLAFTLDSKGAGTNWSVGLASARITPDKTLVMSGYANRVKPFERVEQDIWAKAMALDDGAGGRAVLVTLDLVGLSTGVLDPVCRRISEKTGLRREQMLFNWSHTHSAPTVSVRTSSSPGVAGEDAQNTLAYTRWFQDQLADLVERSVRQMTPARLSLGGGVAGFVMNRREFTTNGVILGVNPRGPVDRSVPVLRVDGADGRPRAVVFGAACHNTTLGPRNLAMCGDYAGFAQSHVQERYPGAQAMFVQGCGGDANPYPRDSMEFARQHGTELGTEVCRVLETRLRPIAGPLKVVLGFADLPLQKISRDALQPLAAKSPSWQIGNAREMLAILDRGEPLPTSYRAPVAVWQFGDSLTLVALSGEVVVDFAHFIERKLGPLQLWVAGYSNDSFGYFPSARVIEEGGYENRGLSNGSGWFSPNAQDVLVNRVAELAREAGRK